MKANTLQLLSESLPPKAVGIIAERLGCAKSTVYRNINGTAKYPKQKIIDAALQYLREKNEADSKEDEEVRRLAS